MKFQIRTPSDWPGFDISRRKMTVEWITRLQTRVDDGTARRFEKAARGREAAAAKPDTWEKHWAKQTSLNLKPAAQTLAELREADGER